MSFQFALQKVMDLKEREKNNSQQEYEEAVRQFEKTATELYHLLKNKEEVEEAARKKLARGTSIYELQQNESHLLRLQQQIYVQQRSTDRAREQMKRKQQKLVQSLIEYKKYEKIKALQKAEHEEEEKRREAREMDEISLRIYARR